MPDLREEFGSGPTFNFYSLKKGDMMKLKNLKDYHQEPQETRRDILLLINLGNRFGYGGRILANHYMDSIEHPTIPLKESFITWRQRRNQWRNSLMKLIDKYIEYLPQPYGEDIEDGGDL